MRSDLLELALAHFDWQEEAVLGAPFSGGYFAKVSAAACHMDLLKFAPSPASALCCKRKLSRLRTSTSLQCELEASALCEVSGPFVFDLPFFEG